MFNSTPITKTALFMLAVQEKVRFSVISVEVFYAKKTIFSESITLFKIFGKMLSISPFLSSKV